MDEEFHFPFVIFRLSFWRALDSGGRHAATKAKCCRMAPPGI